MDGHINKGDPASPDPEEQQAPSGRPIAPDPVRQERWAGWLADNADAIRSSNRWVEQHGLPLERFRRF